MNKSAWRYLLLVANLSAASPYLAQAQTDKLEETSYGFADHPPEMPSGGGIKALTAAIHANFHFPADAPCAQQLGSFGVNAIVSTKGQVAWVSAYGTTRGRIKPSVEAAALAAVRQLPRLKPALTGGEPIQFTFNIDIKLTGQPDSPLVEIDERYLTATEAPDLSDLAGYSGSSAAEEYNPDKVYSYVEQMPALPGGGGLRGVSEAIVQRLAIPSDLPEGIVFVRFVVDKEGAVSRPQLLRGSSPRVDAAVLAAVGKLPRFMPGKQNSRPVNVQLDVRVPVVQPRKPVPAGKEPTPAPH
ncbi:MAG: energy transducer TonB [Janthinobacterium lividum]